MSLMLNLVVKCRAEVMQPSLPDVDDAVFFTLRCEAGPSEEFGHQCGEQRVYHAVLMVTSLGTLVYRWYIEAAMGIVLPDAWAWMWWGFTEVGLHLG